MAEDKHDLDAAYALKTPEDSVRYYRGWAARYDRDFAAENAYRSPEVIAAAYGAMGGRGPVLDVGAGTGLVAQAMAGQGIAPVDGIDISPEMLAVARTKGQYRKLIEADLTKALPIENSVYSGIVSAGTFTQGHVGPEVLPELLRVASSGALFALSVHSAIYDSSGFPRVLAGLGDRIAAFESVPFQIYGPGAAGDHAGDVAWIVSFRKV